MRSIAGRVRVDWTIWKAGSSGERNEALMSGFRPPQDWVGRLVELEFMELLGEKEVLSGWLRGITGQGVYFARAFRSESLGKLMPEEARFYPWAMIGNIRLLD